MRVPPSRDSWIWQIAQCALEHCMALGSRLDDLEIRVLQLKDVAIVSVADWSFKRRGVPLLIASGAIPGADSTIEQEIRQAMVAEQRRLGRAEAARD